MLWAVHDSGAWQIHSRYALDFEKKNPVRKGLDALLAVGIGQGLGLLDWANQVPLLVLIDADLSYASEYLAQLRALHSGEILLLDSSSSAADWLQAQARLSSLRFDWEIKPIYRVFAQKWTLALQDYFAPAPPLAKGSGKLGLLYGAHFLLREMKFVFGQRALPFFDFGQESLEPEQFSAWVEWLETERIQALLCVNLKGLDHEGQMADELKRRGIVLLTWFVDDPRPIWPAYAKLQANKCMALTWEKAYIPWLKKQGFAEVDFLPLAAESTRFHQPFGHAYSGLAFVGSALSGPYLHSIRQKAQLKLQDDWLHEQIHAFALCPDLQLLEHNVQGLNMDFRRQAWLQSLIIHSVSALKREALVREILPLGAEIYGDPAVWRERFPHYHSQIKSEISYPEGIDRVFENRFFQANSTSAQMPSALNQRVFDVPARGAFLLSDWKDDLAELFEAKSWATYQDVAEIKVLYAYYQNHPERAVELLQKQRAQIEKRHLYEHRLNWILNKIGKS